MGQISNRSNPSFIDGITPTSRGRDARWVGRRVGTFGRDSHCWSNTGQILVKYWSNTDQILVKYWSNTGPVFRYSAIGPPTVTAVVDRTDRGGASERAGLTGFAARFCSAPNPRCSADSGTRKLAPRCSRPRRAVRHAGRAPLWKPPPPPTRITPPNVGRAPGAEARGLGGGEASLPAHRSFARGSVGDAVRFAQFWSNSGQILELRAG